MLVYSQTVFSDEMTQSWVLSDPKPTANFGQEDGRTDQNEQAVETGAAFSENVYDLPNVPLIDQTGKEVDLLQVIDYGGPIMLQFIFATCSSICPVLSASFASAQPVLDTLKTPYRFVSISIDPEQDTPQNLAAYAQRFRAGAHWYFLTGDRKNIDSLLKAFRAAYPGNNKMYHKPLTFMRSGPDAPWLLFEKLLGKNEVIAAYKKLVAPSFPPKSDK
ncbi:MAG: SCO family protein [Methylomicrobium sp.]